MLAIWFGLASFEKLRKTEDKNKVKKIRRKETN